MTDLFGAERPAQVRKAESVAELFAAAKASYRVGSGFLRKGNDEMKRFGELLLKAKAAVGRGDWLAALAEHWPDLPKRTAQRWMDTASPAKAGHDEEAEASDVLSGKSATVALFPDKTSDEPSAGGGPQGEAGEGVSDEPAAPAAPAPAAEPLIDPVDAVKMGAALQYLADMKKSAKSLLFQAKKLLASPLGGRLREAFGHHGVGFAEAQDVRFGPGVPAHTHEETVWPLARDLQAALADVTGMVDPAAETAGQREARRRLRAAAEAEVRRAVEDVAAEGDVEI